MGQGDLIDVLGKKVDGMADDVRTSIYRLDKVETRLENLDVKVDGLATKVDNLDTKMDTLTTIVRDMSVSVNSLSRQFGAVASKVMENDQRLDAIEHRVSNLEIGTH